ncbi:MAG: AAA family ATPase [Lachnospirales bacterium]
MGVYLNPGNLLFTQTVNSEIYVDKTGLISYTNKVLGTNQKLICISRPRRFGKSTTANMLSAYYDKSCNSEALFNKFKIAKDSSYEKNINKHNVIFLNMQRFLSRVDRADNLVDYLQKTVLNELKVVYGDYIGNNEKYLSVALENIFANTKNTFIFIIDEWDCIFREKQQDTTTQTKYLDFLRDLLKDQSYVDLAYMTGILPIKKYGTHSALNMFDEFSMIEPKRLAEYVGFTDNEVKELCGKYNLDFEETKKWYDGYSLKEYKHIYNPKSVVDAMLNGEFLSYWTSTETYEALKIYIDMNMDGLKDDIIMMLSGESCKIDTKTFQNDMTTFKTKDDVLTLLIHLGYLSYDSESAKVFIPNEEVRAEFLRSVKQGDLSEIARAIENSNNLLNATLNLEADKVAKEIDKVHRDTTSILKYNDENSLSCVINIAYYSARNDYTIIREFPSGKGFADIVFVPRKNVNKPAIVVELKYDKTAVGAIEQIKNKEYIDALSEYKENLLLVGINYSRETKKHNCVIEKV